MDHNGQDNVVDVSAGDTPEVVGELLNCFAAEGVEGEPSGSATTKAVSGGQNDVLGDHFKDPISQD